MVIYTWNNHWEKHHNAWVFKTLKFCARRLSMCGRGFACEKGLGYCVKALNTLGGLEEALHPESALCKRWPNRLCKQYTCHSTKSLDLDSICFLVTDLWIEKCLSWAAVITAGWGPSGRRHFSRNTQAWFGRLDFSPVPHPPGNRRGQGGAHRET